MPKLAVFPKAYMQALCKDGSMSVDEWIELAVKLDVDGLEWYTGFLEMNDQRNWLRFRHKVEDHGKSIPMLCCSPDFTHIDPTHRRNEIEKQKRSIDIAHALGASFCRVLSGQRRPGISIDEGVKLAAGCIESCLLYARERNITLVLENHYKDDFWEYPEFAQKMDVFIKLVNSLDDPFFGVNYDPSNVLLAGEDPLELLKKISSRVLTMHASDRYIKHGTIEDLQAEDSSTGYSRRLSHGEIGKGLNDYDAIFTTLRGIGFNGWISIEDGVDGFDQLERSVAFLRQKMNTYWPHD